MRARKQTPVPNFVTAIAVAKLPAAAARSEAIRISALARDVADGRISLAEARAQMRGAA